MKGIKRFVKEVLKQGEFDGCWFKQVGSSKNSKDIYLVFSWLDELGLCAKLAINDSSLQCDYEYDWSNLISDDEYVGWDDEFINDPNNEFDLDKFCQRIKDGYNFARKFSLE